MPALKSQAQGLMFNSNDSLMGERTSYTVFSSDVPAFYDHLRMNFDLSLWDNEHLGYVFNIIDGHKNSYSLTYIYNIDGSPALNFNIDSKSNKIKIPLRLSQLNKRIWINVKVDINLKANTVAFFVNGQVYRASDFGFESKIIPTITFGKNPHYSDVPKMAVKNLIVSDDNKTFTFPLNEWSGNEVHDGSGEIRGHVDNPVWLINSSYFWEKRIAFSFREVAGANFNPKDQSLLIFKSDSLIHYDMRSGRISAQAFQNKTSVPLFLGKSILNTAENKLYAYEVLRASKPGPCVASLDLATLKWDIVGNANIKEQRHHHNIFYDKDQHDLYLFGGYGSFAYHNDFFRLNTQTDNWDKIAFTGDRITPRFFSASSQANGNNEVYIFGGYGNQSGNQIVGGRHFYDLYRVNLTNHTIKKCWEIKPNEEDFVPTNNLIIAKDGRYFYALCYPHEHPKTQLRLYKFSIKDGSYQVVSGTIPVTSERIESDINLFFNPVQDEFLCAIQEFTDPNRSTIRILALEFPPVSQQDYEQSQKAIAPASPVFKYVIFGLAAVLVIGLTIVLIKKRREEQAAREPLGEEDPGTVVINKKNDEKRANAIYLLGEFTVYDKSSRDITYLFSPKIKQLFILLLLNSRNATGVVSKKISTILWPDKDVVKTKNIKGVTINHLRNIIADIEGIELTFLNDTYCFKLDDKLFCDYFTVTGALEQINNSEAAVLQYFDLIARGGLLQYIPETWLDDIKLGYEETLMPVILPQVKKIYESGDFRKALDIARVVLNIDPFNDTALKYKLKALRRIKGIEYARKVYDEFTAEYEKSLGISYQVPFDKICSNKTEQK
ncbi:Kelch repeat-containing protein [Mucilaginibacter sp. 22184]|uniref:Kelch repeat-containing protein n=1 Tax=Mucilaginibacter sp. 22184 TaxID=3453887 RepID=UPI003F86FA95